LGHYDAMLRRLTRSFSDRRAVMLDAVRREGLTVAGAIEDGGSSLWMRAAPGVSAEELATALHDNNVLIEPGHPFFDTPSQGTSYYRIAYSSIAADRIPEGIARIAACQSRLLAQRLTGA